MTISKIENQGHFLVNAKEDMDDVFSIQWIYVILQDVTLRWHISIQSLGASIIKVQQ
jgi:hypothetical protein